MPFPDLDSITSEEVSGVGAENTDASTNNDSRDNDRYNAKSGVGGVLVNEHTDDPFWQSATVQEVNWNKSFPFQFVLLEKGDKDYTIKKGHNFTLPIPPQALSISTPFAITGTVTLGGFIEEHNGAPIRNITLQGTTGVMPARGTPKQSQSFGAAGAIFGGTIQGVSQVAAAAIQAGGPGAFNAPNLITSDDLDGDLKHTSGYFQFMMLRSYLEHYVALKKTKDGQRYRLAFAIWKDHEFYLVQPVSFDMQRSAASPLEYTYSIALRAWRRWVPNQNRPPEIEYAPAARDSNKLTQILQRAQAGRRALQGLKSTLTGFRADVDAVVFGPIRELGLYVKDALGVGLTAIDLPLNIVRDFKDAILQSTSVVSDIGAIQSAAKSLPTNVRANFNEVAARLTNLSVIAGVASTVTNPPPSDNQTASSKQGLTGAPGLGAHETDPANGIFDDPDKHPDFFNNLQVGSLKLKPAVQKKIAAEKIRIRNLTRVDFEKKRDAIVKLASDYADTVGAGSATYARTFSRGQIQTNRTPTDDDWEIIFRLNSLAMEFNRLAASTATDDAHRLTAMEYVAGQATRAGIAFKVPQSAYAVPFPYGSTLEVLSRRYLGTPDRWHEIATMNDLRAPWVDEEGFTQPLLVNGSGNDIQVTDISHLVIGQSVWISSNNVPRQRRRVTSIRPLSPTLAVVGLDGDGNLSAFTTSAQAEIFSFLPGTVNSLQLIYIPSNAAAPVDLEPRPNTNIDEFAQLLKVGGVDLLLTESGDLAITRDGDCRLAQGLANIVQRVRLALDTPLGSMMRHADYGFGVQAGTSTADVTAAGILRAARATFAGDPTFTGILGASISKTGPALSIGLNVGIAGYSKLIPLSFKVSR